MNTTYQNTSSLPRSRSTLSPKPERPNTAYRPSHISLTLGMVAQPEAGNSGRKTERAATHKTAGPTIRCKDAVRSVRGGLSSTGLTPVVQSAKASDRNSTGSNPVHPIHIHEISPPARPKQKGTTNHPAKEVNTNMDTRLQKTQNQQLENFLKKQPEIEGDQKQIFQALKEHGPATIEEIGNKIGKPQHTISGRFGELQEKGLIQVKGLTVNERGYKCKQYEVKQ